METPQIDTEAARLNALRQYGILDTEAEAAFDDLTQLAAYLCGTSIALISLIDEHRQWFKSKVGLAVTTMPRDVVVCAHALSHPDDVWMVPDTWLDQQFATHAWVTGEPHMRFYAGVPLTTPAGYCVGILCVIDSVPQQLNSQQIQALQALSRQVMSQLELRRNLAHLTLTTAEFQQSEQERFQLLAQVQAVGNQITTILESITDAFFALDHEWRFTYLNRQAEHLWQQQREGLLGQTLWDEFPAMVGSAFDQEFHKAVSEQVSVVFEAFDASHHSWSEVHAYPVQEGLFVYFRHINQIKQSEEELRRQNLRSQLFAEVSLKIRQSLQLEAILCTTVTEVQRVLQSDRVLLFQLQPDGSGTVVQEAVVSGYPVTLGQDIVDPCFQEEYLALYRQGRIGAIADITQAGILPCYVEFLQQLGVQANLVVPIFIRDTLWGLLIAHQCAHPRQWTEFETQLLQQIADQIGIALTQAELLAQEVQQRQAIAHSQEELRSLSAALESAVEGISQLDTQGRYVKVNPA
ncbi:MAG: GAF domain-containing protein, partial [Leptolyngbyaceae cyanobacterium CRU_2_3]|nr:GAF domain-containing protein [Leptolyngbyaceae cyanobacterium CRU_2_3]